MPSEDRWVEAIQEGARAEIMGVRVATPARIVSIEAGVCRAEVQPLLRRKTAAGVLITPKPIPGVPVLQPRSGGFIARLPIAAGDVGLLIASDRSLDEWLSKGGIVDPASTRHHSLTDAIFIPGIDAWAEAPSLYSTTDLLIGAEDGTTLLRMTPGGEVQITGAAVRLANAAATEALALASLVDARLTTLQAAHDTHVHPVPGVTVGAGATTSSVSAAPVGALPPTAAAKVFGE